MSTKSSNNNGEANAVHAEMRSAIPSSFMAHRDLAHLRGSALLVALASALYLWRLRFEPQDGGTWLGYGLGVISSALILWLMWLGVEKRRYGRTERSIKGWTSAHVYYGLALLVLVPLHSGFQFGWNVHTLAFAAMLSVIGSGALGVVLYGLLPAPMARNRGGQKLVGLLQQLADIDAECKAVVSDLPDAFARAVADSIDHTVIGGGLRRQLSSRADAGGAADALAQIRRLGRKEPQADAATQQLLKLLSRKLTLLDRVQRHLRYSALLELWLVLHVPLAFATLTLVAIHVFVVFYYW